MLQINRILVPTDYSESAGRAFSHAAFLAAWHEAEVHLLHVVEDEEDMLRGDELLSQSELAEQLHFTPETTEQEAAELPNILQVQDEGPSAREAIVNYVNANSIDLVVMGTHGRRGPKRLMLGSTAEGVVRRASCPVLTVRAGQTAAPRRSIERILVPVDFSDSTRLALAYTAELAQTYGTRIDLLHVVNDAAPALAYGYPVDQDLTEKAVRSAEEQLAEMIRDEIGYEHVLSTVVVGHPVTEILDYAEREDSDMIVMPTHGRSGIERFMLGSVAEKVVRRAPCPVFTIKTFGKSILPAGKRLADDASG